MSKGSTSMRVSRNVIELLYRLRGWISFIDGKPVTLNEAIATAAEYYLDNTGAPVVNENE